MSEKDVDIYIGIKVNTEELEAATAKLSEFITNFERLKQVSGTQTTQVSSQGVQALGVALQNTDSSISRTTSNLSGLQQQLGMTNEEWAFANDMINAFPTRNLTDFKDGVMAQAKAMGIAEDQIERYATAAAGLKVIDLKAGGFKVDKNIQEGFFDQFQQTPKGLTQLAKDFAEPVDAITAGLENLAISQSKVAQLGIGAANAHKLALMGETTALGQLASELGMTQGELVKFGQANEKVANDFKVTRAYTIGTRAAIGPLGYMFRDVTMQMYWASLGFLFLTMTMTRADKAALTAQQRAFDLSQAYYNLGELQREVSQTSMEYGAGSEEARKASVRLSQAQRQLELQEKSLAVAIKTEVLQGWQTWLSMVPLTINSAYMLMTVLGSLNGVHNASRASKLLDATSNIIYKTSTDAATGSTVTYAMSVNGATGATSAAVPATGFLAKAQAWLAASLHMSSFAAHALTAALTLGIGVAVALAAQYLMMSISQSETDAMMKKVTEDAKAQTEAWNDLGGQVMDVDKIFSRFKVTIEPIKNLVPTMNNPIINPTGVSRGNANVNVSFPNLTIREEADIKKIAEAIDSKFQANYYGTGGREGV